MRLRVSYVFFEPRRHKGHEETRRDSLLYETNINIEYACSLCVPSCPLCLRGSKSRMNCSQEPRLRVSYVFF